MTETTRKRREDLRLRLIDIAEKTIAREGIGALKARALAKQAECAVGAIYNIFDDLNGIVMAVNGRTFQSLGKAVANSIMGREDEPPTDRLIAMSMAYLEFASDHPRLWRTLFDLKMSTDMEVPAWYLQELKRLFSYIAAPLIETFPEKDPAEIDLMTRALFSSVHGIVLLGIENRISGVPRDQLEKMIALILCNVASQRK